MVQRYGKAAVAALVVTLLVWSTTFAGLRASLAYYAPAHLVLVRWAMASLTLVAYGVLTRKLRVPSRGDLPAIAAAGFFGFTAYQIALAFGQAGLSAGVAGFLINLGPAFTTLLAVALRYERNGWRLWAGLAVSMAGILLIGLAKGGPGGLTINAVYVLLAAASFGVYVVVQKPLLARYTPLEVTTYAMVAGTLPFLVFAPGVAAAVAGVPLAGHLTVAYMALFPGAIAYVTWSRVLAAFGPGMAARFLYLVPVLSLGVAWLWLGEVPRTAAVLGGLVILAGVVLAASKPAAKRRDPVRLGRLAAALLDALRG